MPVDLDLVINPGNDDGNYMPVAQAKRSKPLAAADVVAVWPPPPYVRPAHLPPRPLEPPSKAKAKPAPAPVVVEEVEAPPPPVKAPKPVKVKGPPRVRQPMYGPKKPRVRRPPGSPLLPVRHWTLKKIATLFGIGQDTLARAIRADPELQRLLDAPHGLRINGMRGEGPGSGVDVTDADVARAKRQYEETRPERLYPWCPRNRLTECVSCKRSDSPHCGNGLCEGCYWKAKQTGWNRRWCARKDLDACAICNLRDKPHFSNGHCRPCALWAWHAKKRGVTPEDYAAGIVKRKEEAPCIAPGKRFTPTP